MTVISEINNDKLRKVAEKSDQNLNGKLDKEELNVFVKQAYLSKSKNYSMDDVYEIVGNENTADKLADTIAQINAIETEKVKLEEALSLKKTNEEKYIKIKEPFEKEMSCRSAIGLVLGMAIGVDLALLRGRFSYFLGGMLAGAGIGLASTIADIGSSHDVKISHKQSKLFKQEEIKPLDNKIKDLENKVAEMEQALKTS